MTHYTVPPVQFSVPDNQPVFSRKPLIKTDEAFVKRAAFYAAEFIFELAEEPKFKGRYKMDRDLRETFIQFYQSYLENEFLGKQVKNNLVGDYDSHLRYYQDHVEIWYGSESLDPAWELFRKKRSHLFASRIKYIQEDMLDRLQMVALQVPYDMVNGMFVITGYIVTGTKDLGNGYMRIEGTQTYKHIQRDRRTIPRAISLKGYI